MKQCFYIILLSFFTFTSGVAQIPHGSVCPDFTGTDLNGDTHNLYSYLNSGISVVVDVSATWCGPCWNYHNSNALKNLYNTYGPNGTGDCMVLFIEGDANTNLQCLYGPTGCVGGTQGDWVTNTPYPIIHNEGPSIRSALQVNAYPTVYMISHENKRAYRQGAQPNFGILTNWVMGSFKMSATATVTDAICGSDGAIQLDVTAGYGTKTYQWNTGATTQNLTGVDAGVYNCTITDQNGYSIVSENFVVGGIIGGLFAQATDMVDPSCFGSTNGSVTMQAALGNGNYTYLWDDGQVGQTKINCAAGTHTVTVTDAMGCTFETFAILSQPLELQATTNAPTVPCNQTTGTVTINANGGTGQLTYTLGTTSQNSGLFTGVSPGSYDYSVSDANNCTLNGSLTLQAQTAPTAIANAGGELTCVVEEVTISGAGSSSGNNVSYAWSTSGGTIVGNTDGIDIVASASGTYTLIVTDNTNNCSAQTSVSVNSNTNVPVLNLQTPDILTCTNTSTTLVGSVDGNVSDFNYQWVTTGGNIVSGGNTLTPTVDAPGNYSMQATNIANGCSATVATDVTESINTPSGAYNFTVTDDQFVGEATSTTNGNTYAWSVNGTPSGTESTLNTQLSVGINTICLSLTNECGSDTVCNQVLYSTILTALVNSQNISCYGSMNGSASSQTSGGIAPYTYAWTGPNGFTANTPSIENLASGVYTLVITDASNAEFTQNVIIEEPANIVSSSVSIVNDNNSRGQGSISLTVQGGTGALSYLWSNGATTSNLTELFAGSYTLTVTDEKGCMKVFGPFVVENSSSIDESKYIKQLTISPNPTNAYVSLNVELIRNVNTNVNFLNSSGQVVLKKQYHGDINDFIDVTTFSAGYYIISVSNDEFTINRKLVIVK